MGCGESYRTEGRRHTPLVVLRKVGEGLCEELVLRQEQSGHFVVDAQHLTVVRAVAVGGIAKFKWMQRCARVNSVSRECMEIHIGAECGTERHMLTPAQKTIPSCRYSP